MDEILTWRRMENLHSDVEKILDIQSEISKTADKRIFNPTSREDIKRILNDTSNYVLGGFHDEELVANYITFFPKEQENLGNDIGMNEEDLKKVLRLSAMCIRSNYRHKGLFMIMNSICIEHYKSNFDNLYLMGVVSPFNSANLYNLIKHLGVKLVALEKKFQGNDWRYTFLRNLRYDVYKDKSEEAVCWINSDEIVVQQALFKQNYMGCDLRVIDKKDIFQVGYCKQ